MAQSRGFCCWARPCRAFLSGACRAGEQPAASGVMVKSQIIKANGEPVKVDYMTRRNGDRWLISDIYLDGAISEVATRRSEFAAIVNKEGIDGLIVALNRKADMLTGT